MSDSNSIEEESNAVSDETKQYYVNAVMSSVSSIRRKSFRRLILLYFIIDYESYERKGNGWNKWVSEKNQNVSPTPSNFVYALDVSIVREMKPSAEEFCTDSDVDFVYDVSDDTLKEYIWTIQAIFN